jgi:hypothetical protein
MLGNEELTPQPKPQPDAAHAEIDNFRNDPGLYEPLAEDMKGRYKEYADKAASLTKNMHDLYKAGDPDVRGVVKNWERANKISGKEVSKETMGHEALWEAYMTHYGNLLIDAREREDVPESAKANLEEMGRFDRSSPQREMNMQKINAKLSAKY